MCGIAGKISFGKDIIKSDELPLIEKTLRKLDHRGPDDRGFIIAENIWLASTRLSIIDLSPAGHQPMKSEDGSVYLIFNGEIYNYRQLKRKILKNHKFISHTDSEVIIHLYEEFGTACLGYLRGMFAFAIWDKRRKHLFIARDRLGQKPLKYYHDHNFFIFGSEIKSFIDHPQVPKKIDIEAIDEFLAYQYVPSPKTGFKNIRKLPPAHFMIVKQSGEITIKKYWDIDFSKKILLSETKWMDTISRKLEESVKLRLQSDVPLGIHLSGGLDSSLVTAFASIQSLKPVKTFSIGYRDLVQNELPYARLVSNKYKTEHREYIVVPDIMELLPKLAYQFEEPFADPSILPTWYLMQETRKDVTVALNGDGGDENFAGYRRYQLMKLFKFLKQLPFKYYISQLSDILYTAVKSREISYSSRAILLTQISSDYKAFYQELISFITSNIRQRLYSRNFRKLSSNFGANRLIINKLTEIPENIALLDKLLRVDILNYLPEVLLVKADISSMAHSLEVRSPFLDYEFMELTAKIPHNLKLKNFNSKYILKKIAEKYLPYPIINRKKQGFVPPLDNWLREKHKFVTASLFDRKFMKYDLFKKDYLKKLIRDHNLYNSNNTYILWTILMLKHWLDTWFD